MEWGNEWQNDSGVGILVVLPASGLGWYLQHRGLVKGPNEETKRALIVLWNAVIWSR